jgi:hypothetical protein
LVVVVLVSLLREITQLVFFMDQFYQLVVILTQGNLLVVVRLVLIYFEATESTQFFQIKFSFEVTQRSKQLGLRLAIIQSAPDQLFLSLVRHQEILLVSNFSNLLLVYLFD